MIEIIKENRDLILLAAFTSSLLEFIITHRLVVRYGYEVEANLFLRFIIKRYNLIGLWAFWSLLWTMIIFLMQPGPYFSVFMFIISTYALANNIYLVLRADRSD